MKNIKQQQWLLEILENFQDYPEFKFAEGDFFERLQHLVHYQIGDLKYPVHLLVSHFLEEYSEKMGIGLVKQNLTFRVLQTPVYKIKSDVAIMGQDINRIIGPVEEIMEEDTNDSDSSIEDMVHLLKKFKPGKQGDILVSSPSWCEADSLWEAIIYHFENKKITNAKIVRSILHNCLKKASKLKIKKLSMDALGTEFHFLSTQTFINILCETLFLEADNLTHLEEIVISAKDEAHSRAIKKAIKKTLKAHCLYKC